MLEVKNVSYAYKTKKDKTILNHVSATFEEGIFYTIIGPSGAGKTTLLSLLAGLDAAVKGTVLCNGEDITKKGLNYHRKHNISLVFQNYNLIDYLTTVENVKLGGSGNAEKLLEEVGIGAVSKVTANYLVSQQVQQMQEEEKKNEGKVSTEYVAPKQDVQSISVEVTPEMYLLDGVSVLVLITASVLVSGIVILKRNPKDILAEMS